MLRFHLICPSMSLKVHCISSMNTTKMRLFTADYICIIWLLGALRHVLFGLFE